MSRWNLWPAETPPPSLLLLPCLCTICELLLCFYLEAVELTYNTKKEIRWIIYLVTTTEHYTGKAIARFPASSERASWLSGWLTYLVVGTAAHVIAGPSLLLHLDLIGLRFLVFQIRRIGCRSSLCLMMLMMLMLLMLLLMLQ